DILPDGDNTAPCLVSLDKNSVSTIFTRVLPSLEGRVRIFSTPPGYDISSLTNANDLLLEDKILRADTFAPSELPDIENTQEQVAFGTIVGGLRDSFVDFFIDAGFRPTVRRNTLEDELIGAFLASATQPNPGASSIRYNEEGEIVASVSVPIRKVQAVYGVVTAEIGGIDQVIAEARSALIAFLGVAFVVVIFISSLLTMTIAGPIRRLAAAADRVRDGVRGTGKMRIPEFPSRVDEIGELSDSLRSMTHALYDRIETIDRFAADVSHELKNPITSIRSAIETIDLAKTEEARDKLLGVVKNDVTRMNRLITDISNASRLDADLAREKREAVNINQLLKDIVSLYNATAKDGHVPVRLLGKETEEPFIVFGSPSTLGQVFRNLIDNALSFSPQGGSVRMTLAEATDEDGPVVKVAVADDGPGIPTENLDHIFDRFYTKRPDGAAFGNNSGLGLAICRQVAKSHGGMIWAENRMNTDGITPAGAVFYVTLPIKKGT
ncbi:MAG: HAMP domain-containing sensor histidine kinase, partial [Pseudomonadota bacterium]